MNKAKPVSVCALASFAMFSLSLTARLAEETEVHISGGMQPFRRLQPVSQKRPQMCIFT